MIREIICLRRLEKNSLKALDCIQLTQEMTY
jgi:hypothetical protein